MQRDTDKCKMKTKDLTVWRWWAKALGEKASKCNRESDRIAIIRTVIFLTYLITNAFIVAGVIHHWNDSLYKRGSHEQQIQSIKVIPYSKV